MARDLERAESDFLALRAWAAETRRLTIGYRSMSVICALDSAHYRLRLIFRPFDAVVWC